MFTESSYSEPPSKLIYQLEMIINCKIIENPNLEKLSRFSNSTKPKCPTAQVTTFNIK